EEAPMARIAEAIIDRLKREVSLLALVEAAGIALKRHGKDYLGLCPFWINGVRLDLGSMGSDSNGAYIRSKWL
ncbi:MAG: CHC2 zinc finger domain-containing protein, partial [Chromatiales bacterium]